MKKLIEAFEVQALRERRYDPLSRRLSAELLEGPTGAIKQSTYTPQQEHELQLRLRIRFWANQAQYSTAREAAERGMQDFLYRDVCSRLTQLASLADSASRDTLQRAIYDLIDELRNGG